MKQPPTYETQTHLIFEKEDERAALHSEALSHLQKGMIPKERIALGAQFEKEINEGLIASSAVHFIDEAVGFGLFATGPLPKGAFVGEYVGRVRQNNRHGEMNNYLYSYPQVDNIGRNYVIDAKEGNLIRFVNHSERPNLISKYAFLDGFYHLILITLKEIHIDEQFTYNYGKKYWIVRESPKPLS